MEDKSLQNPDDSFKMKISKYYEIVDFLQKNKCDNMTEALVKAFPDIKEDTLSNIHIQEVRKKVKKMYHRISAPDKASELYQRYTSSIQCGEPPGILVRMAKDIDYSASMLSKLILEQHLNTHCPQMTVGKSQINKFLRDTTLIEDRDLSFEVYLCLLQDDAYGPFSDSIKHSVGHEYEFLLMQELERLKISYQNEDDLRNKGYDKTPDVKLSVPIAVDGYVINWIESKASFGDEESHRTYLKDQLWSYWNRFGAGLVIYWFGYIEELDEHREKGIIIKDKFPTNITFMDPMSMA